MFILGKDYLIDLTQSLEFWCKKYELQPSTSNCIHCNTQISTTVPAFGKSWRGLVVPQCLCGKTTNFKKIVLTDSTEEFCLLKALV